MLEDIKARYGNQFEDELLAEMDRVGKMQVIPEGEELIRPGQYIKSMPLLLRGSIKIMRPDPDGEELLLYYLEEGDTCTMTMACCVGQTRSEIRAVSETPVEIVMIPVELMEDWAGKYKSWRQFVFKSYHNRMLELLESVDDLAFKNMEERLERYLQNKTELTGEQNLYTTHQEIARDLHTSRVVVSRLLKKMEKEGMVKLHRNFIEVV
jgi:CRP/FNR family transcriptional regulator